MAPMETAVAGGARIKVTACGALRCPVECPGQYLSGGAETNESRRRQIAPTRARKYSACRAGVEARAADARGNCGSRSTHGISRKRFRQARICHSRRIVCSGRPPGRVGLDGHTAPRALWSCWNHSADRAPSDRLCSVRRKFESSSELSRGAKFRERKRSSRA